MGCNRFAGAGVYHRAKSVIFLELFDHIYFVVFKGLVIELFFLTYKGVRFFSSFTSNDRYIFSVSLRSRRLEVVAQEKAGARKNGPATQAVSVYELFSPGISLQEFFLLEISLQDTDFF